MRSFNAFLSRKERENKEHLHILEQILKKAGFPVSNYLDDNREPYIYVHKPVDADPILEGLSFGGIRLYTRGREIICYRSQNKEQTEPFGNTYLLDVKGMFKDLVRESSKDAVGRRIIFYIVKELKDFFLQSAAAEKEGETPPPDAEMGSVVVGNSGPNDYSNQVTGTGTNYGGAGG